MTKYLHHAATSHQIARSSGLELTAANIGLVMSVLPLEGSSQRVKFIHRYPHNIEPLQDFTLYCIKKGRATRHFFFIHNISHQIVILPPYTVRANKHSIEDHMAWISEIRAPEIIQQNLAKIQEIPPSASAGHKPVPLVSKEKKSSIEEKEDARPRFEPNLAARKKIEHFCDYMYSQTRDKSKTYSTSTYNDWLDELLQYIEECPLPCYFEKDGKYLKLVIMQYDNEQNHIVGNNSDFLKILEGKDYEKLTLRQQHCFLRSLTITLFSEKIFQLTGKGLEREFVKNFLKVILLAIENGSLAKLDPRLHRWIEHFRKNLGKSFVDLLTQEMALNLFKYLYGYFLESKKDTKERNAVREILSYFLPFLIEEEVSFIFRPQLSAADVVWFIEKIEPSLMCSTVSAVLDWVVALEGTKESGYSMVLSQLNKKVHAAVLTDAQRAVIGNLIYNRLICKGIAVEKYKKLFEMASPFNQTPIAAQIVKPQERRSGPSTAHIPTSSDHKQQGPRKLIPRKGQPPAQPLGLKHQIELQTHFNRIVLLQNAQNSKFSSGSNLNLSHQIPQEIGSFFSILAHLPADHPLEKQFYKEYIQTQCFLVGAGKRFNAIEYCLYKQQYEVVARLQRCYSDDENATEIFEQSFRRILQLIISEQMPDAEKEHNDLNKFGMSSTKNVAILIGRFFETLSKLPKDSPLKEEFLKRFYKEYVVKKTYHVHGGRYINAIEYCLLRGNYDSAIHMYDCYKDYEDSADIFQQALYVAISQTNPEAVRICLTFGCDPNKGKGLFAECCAHPAQWQNKAKEKIYRLLDIIKLLVEAGGDPYRCRKEEEIEGFGPSLLDMVVSHFDIQDGKVRGLVNFLKERGISHVTGPELYGDMNTHFLDKRIFIYKDLLEHYMKDKFTSNEIKQFLTDNPEFINSKFMMDTAIICPIIFIAIWHRDEELLRFLLEKFSPYLGKRNLPNSFFEFENDKVSPLEAAVCVGFNTGIEILLEYGSPTDLAANIRRKANPEILSLIDSHSDYGPQQRAINRVNDEPYSPFWEASSSSSLSSTVPLSEESSGNSDAEADDEIYNGFTPMAMCRLV